MSLRTQDHTSITTTGNVDEVGRVTIVEVPGGQTAQTLHRSAYDAVVDAYQDNDRRERDSQLCCYRIAVGGRPGRT